MSVRRPSLRIDAHGGTAAEFAMVLPILLLFIFGMIDAGRFMWACNRAEKATQMGVRYAVATNIVPAGLVGYSFATSGGIPQGDPISESDFTGVQCTSTGSAAACSCLPGPGICPPLGTADNAAFRNIVDRMRRFFPEIQYSQVRIEYDRSGLGYAGNPNGLDVAPLVRVSLRQDAGHRLAFQPLTLLLFGASIPLPSFSAALTLEDGNGTAAN